MPGDLLKRIIERASDSMARDVYLRMLKDRRAEKGPAPPLEAVPSWEEIAARALKEGILSQEEAIRLLARVKEKGP